jgi:uncharacterized membrane protein
MSELPDAHRACTPVIRLAALSVPLGHGLFGAWLVSWRQVRRGTMETTWTGSVEIAAPVERVYAYLADFPRHCEWAQTLERMEQKKAGDAAGVGATYLTFERQAFQADRPPRGPLPAKAFKGKTLAEVREKSPNRRLAWHSHPVPRMGVWADIAFDVAPDGHGGTRLTQTIAMHQAWLPLQLFARLAFKTTPAAMEAKAQAQWQASLNNIKALLEHASPEHAGSSALKVKGLVAPEGVGDDE